MKDFFLMLMKKLQQMKIRSESVRDDSEAASAFLEAIRSIEESKEAYSEVEAAKGCSQLAQYQINVAVDAARNKLQEAQDHCILKLSLVFDTAWSLADLVARALVQRYVTDPEKAIRRGENVERDRLPFRYIVSITLRRGFHPTGNVVKELADALSSEHAEQLAVEDMGFLNSLPNDYESPDADTDTAFIVVRVENPELAEQLESKITHQLDAVRSVAVQGLREFSPSDLLPNPRVVLH